MGLGKRMPHFVANPFFFRQPSHTRTIEGELFGALVKAGAVSQDNADDPVKVISTLLRG